MVVAALGLGLVGCAGPAADPGGSSAPPATTPGGASSAPGSGSGAEPAVPGVPGDVKPSPGDMVLSGTIVAGVESGCRLIQTAEGGYVIVGAAAAKLRTGAAVTVRGRVRPDMITTCNQGQVFEVTAVVTG
ncbi:hypothetical protein GCM10010201_29790 [Pilimelia columellifera subsp. columellifera]|uniref:Lipoprotein n=1 Tax=Pilimelia columellifera subsp. columellifera TaxID=706583 RepID=A0ABN3NNJ1_9ACTN